MPSPGTCVPSSRCTEPSCPSTTQLLSPRAGTDIFVLFDSCRFIFIFISPWPFFDPNVCGQWEWAIESWDHGYPSTQIFYHDSRSWSRTRNHCPWDVSARCETWIWILWGGLPGYWSVQGKGKLFHRQSSLPLHSRIFDPWLILIRHSVMLIVCLLKLQKVAVKMEKVNDQNYLTQQLHIEQQVYRLLYGGVGIPNAWYVGSIR